MDKLTAKKISRHSLEDILLYLNKNEEDTNITRDIISDIEDTAAEGLEKYLCVAIPYIGRIRRSQFRELMKEGKVLLHDAKKRLSKEDYVEYRINLYRKYRGMATDMDRSKMMIERLIRLNKKQYNKIYSSCGKAYADRWVKKIGYLKIIEHDENDINEI